MPVKPRREKVRQGPNHDQMEHLIEGYSLEFFPFSNDEEREKLYFENKSFLIEFCRDPRRKHEHHFYTEGREMPEAYFQYETDRGRRKWAIAYAGIEHYLKLKGAGRSKN